MELFKIVVSVCLLICIVYFFNYPEFLFELFGGKEITTEERNKKNKEFFITIIFSIFLGLILGFLYSFLNSN